MRIKKGYRKNKKFSELLEALAALEHMQWVKWSKDIARSERISKKRLKRWKEFWVPYSKLSEEVKEFDREWAEKVIAIAYKVLGEKKKIRLDHIIMMEEE